MELSPQIFTATVMHKRFFPKVNQFNYGIYYLALPLKRLYALNAKSHIAINKRGIVSFYEKDHGSRGKQDLQSWIDNILSKHTLSDIIDNVVLVSMPRIFGYTFNPVSFWLCLDKTNQLRAVLCEVNNTFGETHCYFCMKDDGSPIRKEHELTTQKLFHVSPFLERKGHYQFRFLYDEAKLGIWIDLYDADNNKQLTTSLTGNFENLTRISLRRVFWKYPIVTLKTITLIHLQAMKLLLKRIKYVKKPLQNTKKISHTSDHTKM